MPFIFPRRVLRQRDVLVPREMTEDLKAAYDLLASGLDRHNFCGARMKENLEPVYQPGFEHETLPEDSNRYVSQYAYHKLHTAASESFYIMDRDTTATGDTKNKYRTPPNFVEPDGVTFRDEITLAKKRPYIVPHTGEWSAVSDGRSGTSPVQLTFTTDGQKTLWLCAYIQYIWQGFFELKPPWVGDSKCEDVQHEFTGSELSHSDIGWELAFGADEIVLKERDILNHFGPDRQWKSYLSSSDTIIGDEGEVSQTKLYEYQLNERTAKEERSFPNLGGFHHISRGFYPSLVQFALRVDGKIIEETITGKHYSFEESAHGTQVDASPVYKSSEKGGSVRYHKRFGQRETASGMFYGTANSKTGGAGQKLSQSRATSCGPEVMPVRIGAVIPLTSGDHTVEIVARRLERKRRKFVSGDFVGVFSRRLVGIELTKMGAASDILDDGRHLAEMPNFETEDVLHRSRIKGSRVNLQDQLNSIRAQEIKPQSLPNTHLPTKVTFAESVNITGKWYRTERTGLWTPVSSYASEPISLARFPGFQHSSYIDKVASGSPGRGWKSTYTDDAGWEKITSDSFVNDEGDFVIDYSRSLKIVGNGLNITSGVDSLLIMADIEVKWIRGMLSDKAEHAFTTDVAQTQNSFTSYLLDSKYLDLFALFAIGYRTGSDPSSGWTIASQHAPAMVNSFNWVNRSSNFLCDRTEGDLKLTAGAYGTGSSDYSFSTRDYACDRRGGNALTSNMGCNVPLMLALKGETIPITEVAVFVSTTFPDIWSAETAVFGSSEYASEARIISDGACEDQWAAPTFGRGILKGVEVSWGNCSLSALKLTE
jgi:hypothetical protein